MWFVTIYECICAMFVCIVSCVNCSVWRCVYVSYVVVVVEDCLIFESCWWFVRGEQV